MKNTLTILFIALTISTFGQITTTKVVQKVDSTKILSYDSTQNFLGRDAKQYIGQELYLKGKPESSRKYGYDGFSFRHPENLKELGLGDRIYIVMRTYKCCAGVSNSIYDSLVGKYFQVLNVSQKPESDDDYYQYRNIFTFKLRDKGSGDTVFYEYDSEYEFKFPFIVVGFFEKQKKLAVGKEFVFACDLSYDTDIQTGKKITYKLGQIWKCVDITVDENKYDYELAFIIKNEFGEKILIMNASS
jgi:hypothetical protein